MDVKGFVVYFGLPVDLVIETEIETKQKGTGR